MLGQTGKHGAHWRLPAPDAPPASSPRTGGRLTGAGFTLIELALVVVVIAVLAAMVLPRFQDLKSEARAATVTTGAKSVLTAASLVHMRVIASGTPIDSTIRQLDIGGGEMVDVRFGYPACTTNGIPKASGTDSGRNGYVWYLGTDANMCSLYPDAGKDSSGHTIYLNNCGVMYVNSSGNTWSPITTGC